MKHPNHITNDWTDERIETAKRMRADGKSAAKIGAALGITRNAVIGKLARLKVPAPPYKAKGRPRTKVNQPPQRKLQVVPSVPYALFQPVSHTAPLDTRRTIMQLRPQDCRWPCEESFYCGVQIGVGCGSYCAGHYAIGTRPALYPSQPIRRAA